MSEFIIIQVGQCGNQVGNQFWTYALQEHGLCLDTRARIGKKQSHNKLKPSQHTLAHTPRHLGHNDALESFFWSPDGYKGEHFNTLEDLKKANVKARAVLVDMEDGVVSRLQNGPLKQLFDDKCVLTNYPGSGNNWAVGHMTHGNYYHDSLVNVVRRAVERCDALQGFLLLCSLGGGTGSGVGTAVLRMLQEEFSEIERFVSCVYPSENDDVITAPYNALLATHELTEHASCVFPVDNQALLDICARLHHQGLSNKISSTVNLIPSSYTGACKPYEDMNNIVANMLLHLTSSARFPGSLNVDINEIYTNLVPFEGLHYLASSLSPLYCIKQKRSQNVMLDEMFSASWSRDSQLLKLDPLRGSCLGAALVGRGAVNVSDMRRNIEKLQRKVQFLPWTKSALKVGLCSVPPLGQSHSLLTLINTSSITNLFDGILEKFTKLYKRKAHVHHYLEVEGMEESSFTESRVSLCDLIHKYRDLEKRKNLILPRLHVL